MKKYSLPKQKRLVTNGQFKRVLADNLRVSNGLLVMYIAENNCGYPRLGVSVGKSFGKAVLRNRLKRLLREVFRQSQDRIPAGFDYVLMPSPHWLKTDGRSADSYEVKRDAIEQLSFEQVRESFLHLVARAVKKVDKNSDYSK